LSARNTGVRFSAFFAPVVALLGTLTALAVDAISPTFNSEHAPRRAVFFGAGGLQPGRPLHRSAAWGWSRSAVDAGAGRDAHLIYLHGIVATHEEAGNV